MWAFCGDREENLFQPPDNILPLGKNYSLAFFISIQTIHQKRSPPNPKHGHLFGTFHGIFLLLSGCAQHRHTLAQKNKQNGLDLFNQFCSIFTPPLPQPKTLVFPLWVTGEVLIELLSCLQCLQLVAILHTWPRYLPSTRSSGGSHRFLGKAREGGNDWGSELPSPLQPGHPLFIRIKYDTSM